MPSSSEILSGLAAIANSWQSLAVAWHLYFLALAGLIFAARLSRRLAGILLVLPMASVSVLAFVTDNFFNAFAFAAVGLFLLAIALRMPARPVTAASGAFAAAGAAMVAFGWVYPHFLDETAVRYLIAAPLGLIPCPTLSMILGISLLLRGLGSPAWTAAVAIAGLFYGVFGAVQLDVSLDWVLVGGSLLMLSLLAAQLKDRQSQRQLFP